MDDIIWGKIRFWFPSTWCENFTGPLGTLVTFTCNMETPLHKAYFPSSNGYIIEERSISLYYFIIFKTVCKQTFYVIYLYWLATKNYVKIFMYL